ncbi:MAG: aminotransferase class I/II-fold pyridoxal phosphate-dependent enzyme [Blastocatellia bacterium]|nr:aminotransferase class I/II-fold pyridoxal phosphate-dependent enzyme [Blastocatellia bacterium]
MIDLRSDTVTKPTRAMRAAMASADVGDDVFGEDPTVNRLQDRAAEIFEKEAALFVPSGCMGNQIAVKVHSKPGDEIVMEDRSHIFQHEMASSSIISGVLIRPVRSEDRSGHLRWNEIETGLRLGADYDSSRTALICLENTHNMAGGTVMSAEHCAEICEKAHVAGLSVHLDGARIFNAALALNTSVSALTRHCDSVQFCLSKGLGAPIGSILMGSRVFIEEARSWRKRLGGGMRQAGILAAAGMIALEESPKRLHEDHANARRLAEGLAEIPQLIIDPETVVTNILIVDISKTGKTQADICNKLRENGIFAFGWDSVIRLVTHCDITSGQVDEALAVITNTLRDQDLT